MYSVKLSKTVFSIRYWQCAILRCSHISLVCAYCTVAVSRVETKLDLWSLFAGLEFATIVHANNINVTFRWLLKTFLCTSVFSVLLHYITLETIQSGLSKRNFNDHYGEAVKKTMSGYDCRNKWVFSFRRNVVSDGADWTSTGKLFQSCGPAAANYSCQWFTVLTF